jgi:thiamine kinase-like enzyme
MPSTDAEGLQGMLEAVLGRVLARPVGVEAFRSMEHGVSNRSYLVTAEGVRYVVKLRQGGLGDVLTLQAEAEVMDRAAAAGLAPAVVGADAEAGALVSRYRSGARPLTRAAAREPRNIERVAALLRALHELPAELRPLECAACARAYVQAAGNGSTARERDLAAELVARAASYDERYPRSVLCHNDLIADNILDDRALSLVDFEYAMRAAPILDLASFATMNRLGADARRSLVRAYYAERAVPFTAAEFDGVVRLLQLVAFFWARAAARESGDPARFSEFAGDDVLE